MKQIALTLIVSLFSLSCFAQESIPKAVENFNTEWILRYCVDGNFTNSGQKEIIAFYQSKSSAIIEGKQSFGIGYAYCFVIDNKQGRILKTYELPKYITISFDEHTNLSDMPMDELGKNIEWMGYSYGRVGDFNDNGIDELYLYQLVGYGFYPAFFEFDEKVDKFKSILQYKVRSADLLIREIDKDKKEIIFEDGTNPRKIVTYAWDKTLGVYTIVAEENGKTY